MELWHKPSLCSKPQFTRLWMTPNPITILALSLWTHSRWTMVAHHTIHGGASHRVRSHGHGTVHFRTIKPWDPLASLILGHPSSHPLVQGHSIQPVFSTVFPLEHDLTCWSLLEAKVFDRTSFDGRGYNKVDPSGHYSSKNFGMGSLWRRVVDWPLGT